MAPQPQPTGGGTYAAKIKKEEAQIDWTQAALQIDRQVRAFNPSPVAETKLAGEQVRVWEARPIAGTDAAHDNVHLSPGGVVHTPDGRLLVATGAGWLELLRLQLPGRKPLLAREFSNARRLTGARFGDAS